MRQVINNIKFIVFDADDTLWENENHFQKFESEFCNMLKDYASAEAVSDALFKTETKNLHLYGYGAKGMILCMIETLCNITKNNGDLNIVNDIIKLGIKLLQKPVILLPDVENVLKTLSTKYKLVLATKGDLSDQKRKISNSGLDKYFYHIEIMNNKEVEDYKELFNTLECHAEDMIMIGNSIKSDILPILELGGCAIQIPFYATWQHEQHHENVVHDKYLQLKHFKELLKCFN